MGVDFFYSENFNWKKVNQMREGEEEEEGEEGEEEEVRRQEKRGEAERSGEEGEGEREGCGFSFFPSFFEEKIPP